MCARQVQLSKVAEGYLHKTHRPLNCLVFILPFLVAYEVGSIFIGDRLLAPRYLAAALGVFGASGAYVPPASVVAVLFVWHVVSRQRWHVDADALLGMLAESALWVIPIFGAHALTQRLLGPVSMAARAGSTPALAGRLLTGIGAGVYEEFLFRLVAIGAALGVLVDIFGAPRRAVLVGAIAASSICFSAVHFVYPAETFRLGALAFRAAAGVYLAVLYVARGFGVAVGVHACYNVAVTLLWRSGA